MRTRIKRRERRILIGAAAALTAAPLLAACGGSSSSGTPEINFYNQPGTAIGTQANVDACNKTANGKYKIVYDKLPSAADQQRLQLVRRMAARDSSVDLLGLDVTWEAEFSEAGWIVPWTGKWEQIAKQDQLPGPLDTATWKGQVVAIPYNSNAQLLWYRSDLVKTPPKTWDDMITAAEALAKQGQPHYIQEQGAQYEGLTVWVNSMISSAGGHILNGASTKVALDDKATVALQTMKKFATSSAADPSLSNAHEDDGRLAMEAGTSAFEINYPYVYPSMQTDNPQVPIYPNKAKGPLKNYFKYAPFPSLVQGQPAHSTIGGIDIAVSKYSKHRQAAFEAAACIASKPQQLQDAIVAGQPPTLASIYNKPTKAFIKAYPFYKLIQQELQNAAVRPKTPAYQSVSIVISHAVSPPSSIDPPTVIKSLKSGIADALQSKGLVP